MLPIKILFWSLQSSHGHNYNLFHANILKFIVHPVCLLFCTYSIFLKSVTIIITEWVEYLIVGTNAMNKTHEKKNTNG